MNNKITLTGPNVTPEDVKNSIKSEEYMFLGEKTTVCLLTLINGFEVVGSSAPVNPKLFNKETGKIYAKEKAIDQVWMHLGSILHNQ